MSSRSALQTPGEFQVVFSDGSALPWSTEIYGNTTHRSLIKETHFSPEGQAHELVKVVVHYGRLVGKLQMKNANNAWRDVVWNDNGLWSPESANFCASGYKRGQRGAESARRRRHAKKKHTVGPVEPLSSP